MLQLLERDWKPIADQLQRDLWGLFFYDIYELADRSLEYLNSRSALIDAIRSGRVAYRDGMFSGKMNMSISAALAEFATYDGRAKAWRPRSAADVPTSIIAAATVANDKAKRLERELSQAIDNAQARLEQAIRQMGFPIADPLDRMNKSILDAVPDISVLPEITDRMRNELIVDYNLNQQLNIKNWAPDQVERLRDMVSRFALRGYRRNELRDMVMQEWGVTYNKAQFLARQETSLFMSKLRRERYTSGGIRKYRWSSSQDERTRQDHLDLHGKVFQFGDPPIVDKSTGRRAEPGEDFNCRCQAIPIIE